ncbi:hypothetical protein [Chengkuizengella marina]|nr:hypothetical protein [Chengkuizengella marina]
MEILFLLISLVIFAGILGNQQAMIKEMRSMKELLHDIKKELKNEE